MTILLLGSDARPGEEIDAVRADIIVVLRLDPASGSCRLLSIPRDTRVNIPGIGETKINHALMEGGVPLQTGMVEQLLGIPIDAYGLIDFSGAANVIDAVGGVTVTNPAAFEIEGTAFAAGQLHLDGEHAVLYARYRGGDDGDFGRMHRQQQVFSAVLAAVGSAQPTDLLRIGFGTLGSHFKTDLSLDTLLELASTYRGQCTSQSLVVETLPAATEGMMWDDLYDQQLWFLTVDPAIVQQKVNALMGER